MRGVGVWSAVYSIVHTLLLGGVRGHTGEKCQNWPGWEVDKNNHQWQLKCFYLGKFPWRQTWPWMSFYKEKNCTYLSQGFTTAETEDHCFCHKAEWNFKQAWSTIQIQVESQETISISPRLKKINCVYPDHIMVYLTCILHYLWKPADSKRVNFHVRHLDQDFCFDVKSGNVTQYRVSFTNIWFNPRLFALFISGFLLFCFAGKLSRTPAAFYVAGIIFGVAASPLLFVIVLKRFISKHSTFWLLAGTCLFLTAYSVHFIKENLNWIWPDNKHYVLGYFITFGFLSLLCCYRHGPLSSERSIALFTWTLQIIACFLIYFGLAVSEIAFTLIAGLASCKGLYYSFKVLHYVKRLIIHKKPVVKLLTEEEYREQADTETTKALEELRNFCNSPDLNSWLVVSRLSSPGRFAQFILGSNHVSLEETSTHEEQYGLGSAFLEEQLFQESQNSQQMEFVPQENEHSEDYINAFDPSDSESSVLLH